MIHDLRVTLTETAPVLDWTAPEQRSGATDGKPAGVRIYRAEVDPAAGDAAISDPSRAKLIAPPVLLAQTTEMQYRDTSFQFGHTYFYSVREAVQFGAEIVESADSAPAILTAKDIFPPATPRDLEAVSVPAMNGTSGLHRIDLDDQYGNGFGGIQRLSKRPGRYAGAAVE